MAEPISDSELAKVRGLVDIGLMEHGGGNCAVIVLGAYNESAGGYPYMGSISVHQVASILARLDAAEAKLARIAKLLAPRDYIALPTLIVIKEIVDG